MRDTCPLGVTSATLSDWQARQLAREEQQRLAAHISDCAACQRRLDRFARIALAVRAPVAEPSAQAIWRSLHGRILLHERGSMRRTQKIAALSGLGLGAVVVIVFALIFANFPQRTGVSVTATATFSVNPTSTPLGPTPTVAALAGWSLTNVMHSPISLAFSASNPRTGYLCGANQALTLPNAGPAAPLVLSVTKDGGASWGALLPLPGSDFACNVAINPADPRDVVITEMACDFGCAGGFPANQYYRSRDGGQTWTHLLIPQGNTAALTYNQPANSGQQPGDIFSFAWTGSTIWVIGLSYAANNPPELYRSVNGAPLARVDLTSDPTAAAVLQNDEIEYAVFSLGNIVYLPLGCKGGANCPFLTSSDNGASWQEVIPNAPGPLSSIIVSADGKTLIGRAGSDSALLLVRSQDGGHTWQSFPALPSGQKLYFSSSFVTTPDGTSFVEEGAGTSTSVTVYRLAPNAAAWAPVFALQLAPTLAQAQVTPYPTLTAVAANANGQPQTIWGILEHATVTGIDLQLYRRPA